MTSNRLPTAVVLTHEPLEGPDRLTPALRRAGFEVVERLRDPRPEDVDADALVVMGGPMAVYEAEQYPWLQQEIALVRERLRADRPVLGVCLGAQILAAAAGSRVYAGDKGMVIGVQPVTLTSEGLEDPLFAGFEESFDVVHWHGDTFDPVPGSKLLASTARYPQQAFRVGRSVGVQFHAELGPEMYAQWLRAFPESLVKTGRDVDEAIERDLPKLERAMHPLTLLVERLARELAPDLGAGPAERFLFTVEQANPLGGSAVVLMPGIPRRTPIVRVGDPVILHRPDGSRVEGKVRGMASFGDTGAAIPLLVQLQDGSAVLPPGTEVLTTASPA